MAQSSVRNKSSERINMISKSLFLRASVAIGMVAFALTCFSPYILHIFTSHVAGDDIHTNSETCRQVAKLSPKNQDVENFLKSNVESSIYQAEIIQKLIGLIRIPSESYDELGAIGVDKRWDVFYDIEGYLQEMYPLVFQNLILDHANTHGLILTWEGSVAFPAAKPILMLAHQDVVPVLADNVKDWKYPPYEGVFDGEFVWGRGATDDKGYLISIIEAVDLLIKSGFKPKRTIVLAFGCDEEISGENCGRPISNLLHDRYGDDGIYLIMDEGSVGIQREFNQTFAMVSVAEKGYLDVGINVTSSGGHASNPPDHNAIGIMSEIIMAIEANAFEARLTPRNPMFGFLECAAAHAPEALLPGELPLTLRRVALGDKKAQRQLAETFKDMRYYFKTSQSVGKINGGVKINAIPELVSAMVNLRLSVESSVALVQNHYESWINPIAQKHQMAFEGFNSRNLVNKKGKISLVSIDPLEPAPVSPTNSESFQVLSGTIRNTLRPLEGDSDLIVTPYLMPANTDTKFFWALSKNIYRFTPINLVDNLNRAHTTNEFIRASEFVREPYFFGSLILNADDIVAG